MGQTCYVRYPDADKDDPGKPGEPNQRIEISSHKLDDYRARGFVQCEEDGSAVTKPIPRIETHPEGGFATHADDPEAKAILKDDVAPEVPKPKPPAPAPAAGGNA